MKNTAPKFVDTTRYKHIHTGFNEVCIKDLAKALFQAMGGQELQDPKKMLTICVQNLESFVRKMNSTKSLAIGMKPKNTTKEENLELVKAEEYPR